MSKLKKKIITKKKKDIKLIILIGIISLFVIIGGSLISYVSTYSKANEDAIKAMESNQFVEVINTKKYIAYEPVNTYTKGLVIYPTKLVEPTIYSRLCQDLASRNILVVVAKMPLNLPSLGKSAGNKILEEYKDVSNWYLAGHLTGGITASKYLKDNYQKYKGMIYLGSYSNNYLNENLKLLSILGTKDSVINIDKFNKSANSYLKNADFIEIKGGNHTQFGDFDLARKDSKASISYTEQRIQTLNAIMTFMSN